MRIHVSGSVGPISLVIDAFNLVEMTGWDMGIYMQALSSGISGHLFYVRLILYDWLSIYYDAHSHGGCQRGNIEIM